MALVLPYQTVSDVAYILKNHIFESNEESNEYKLLVFRYAFGKRDFTCLKLIMKDRCNLINREVINTKNMELIGLWIYCQSRNLNNLDVIYAVGVDMSIAELIKGYIGTQWEDILVESYKLKSTDEIKQKILQRTNPDELLISIKQTMYSDHTTFKELLPLLHKDQLMKLSEENINYHAKQILDEYLKMI